MTHFTRTLDKNGQLYLETNVTGYALTRTPLLNKGAAFSFAERQACRHKQ
jgi:lipoprotein signal peptidase